MLLLGIILMAVGVLLSLIGQIWMLVEAFRTGIWWGLGVFFGGCLFGIPILVWIVKYWKEAWPPLLTILGAYIPALIGMLLFLLETTAQVL